MSFCPAVESLLHQWQTLLASVGPILKEEVPGSQPSGDSVERIGRRLDQRQSLEMSYTSFATFRGGLMVNYRE